MNAGPQPHEVIFLQLAPGKTVQDFAKWAGTGMKGPPPGKPIDGMSGFSKGRTGTFALQHSGTMTRGVPQLIITVVPDSGTGELVGLSGKMMINIVDGKHSYDFEYTLDLSH